MANIFEQVQRGISDPQGGGFVSGFTPTPSTPDPLAVAIEGITTLGKLGKQIHTDVQVDRLKGELQTGLKDFVAAEEAEHVIGLSQQAPMLEEQTAEFFKDSGAAPAEEAALLTDMRQRIKTWDTAFKQKRISASEFKIKMDSTLKKYINMNPSIASELRQAASGSLGFDPTGSELDAIFAQQKADAQTSDEIQKATVGVMKEFGLMDPMLSVEQNVSLYGQKALSLKNSKSMIDFQYDAANKANLLSKDLQNSMANQSSGLDIANSKQSIDVLLNSNISPIDKQTAIESQLSQIRLQYRQKFPKLSASEIDNILKPMTDLATQAKDVASGKLTKESYDNIYQANTNAVLAGFSGSPEGARYLATIKMAKNLISIPSSVQKQMEKGLKALAGVETLQVRSLGTNGTYSPFNEGRELPEGGSEAFDKWFKGSAETITKNADPKDPEQVKQFQNIIEGIMVPMFSDPDRVKAIEYDTMLKMAGSPKFVEMLKAMPDSDRIKSKLARVSAQYGTALLQKFGTEVFDKYDPSDIGMKSRFSLKEEVFGINKEKLVEINIDNSTGEFFFTPKQGLEGEKASIADSVARGYTKQYASRLNDAIKLTAHLKGHTNYKGMLDQYMARTPELLFFMKDAKEAE